MNGMEQALQVLLALIRYAVSGEEPPASLADGLSGKLADRVLALAEHHSVTPMAAQILHKLADRLDEETAEKCKAVLFSAVMRYERMNYEYQETCGVLEQAGISFIPLKGAVLRERYPEPWLRTSCDIDILVRDVDTAARVLSENGYVNKGKGSHDILFRTPGGMSLELHFVLIETDKRVNAVLEHVWDYADPTAPGSSRYILRDEMLYFYHLAHMAKHFSMAGCGIRFFVDTWLLTARTPCDPSARTALLEKGGLNAFGVNAEKLSRVWLEGGVMDPLLAQMETFILQSGTLGSNSNQVRVHKAKTAGKTGFLLYRIFMPYSGMRLKYPVLKKCPVLLPIFWIVRWVQLLTQGSKRKNALQEMKMNQKLDPQSIRATKWMLDELGLY